MVWAKEEVVAPQPESVPVQVGFISTQLLNKLSYKVPVAQVLKEIERFSNPEQSGLSSLICLEDVCI